MKVNVLYKLSMVLLASTGVSATESGFYLGAGGSDVSVSLEQSSVGWTTFGRSVERSGVRFDDSDFGWEVFVGFQFNRFVGAEVDFQEFDETSATFAAATSGNSFINEQAQVSEFSGAVTGTYPLNREFGLFGKVGAARWNVDGTATTAVGGTAVSFAARESGTNLLLSLGGRYNFNDRAVLRFEWEHYSDIGIDGAGTAEDIDVFGGSLLYRF